MRGGICRDKRKGRIRWGKSGRMRQKKIQGRSDQLEDSNDSVNMLAFLHDQSSLALKSSVLPCSGWSVGTAAQLHLPIFFFESPDFYLKMPPGLCNSCPHFILCNNDYTGLRMVFHQENACQGYTKHHIKASMTVHLQSQTREVETGELHETLCQQ